MAHAFHVNDTTSTTVRGQLPCCTLGLTMVWTLIERVEMLVPRRQQIATALIDANAPPETGRPTGMADRRIRRYRSGKESLVS